MYARTQGEYLDDLPDGDLVRRLKLGSDEALSILAHRHFDALYRYCLHLARSREDAEDICQETLVRAMTRLDSLKAGAAFRSWLFSIARNLAIDQYRGARRVCPMPEEETMPVVLYEDTPYEQVEGVEERQTVAQALEKLADNHRRVLVLREVEGLSYSEIARRLDVSHSAVETLLFRARRRLREEYSKTASIPGAAVAGVLRALAARLGLGAAGAPLAKGVLITAAVIGGFSVAAPHAPPIHWGAAATARPLAHPILRHPDEAVSASIAAISVTHRALPSPHGAAVAHRTTKPVTLHSAKPTTRRVTTTVRKTAHRSAAQRSIHRAAHRPARVRSLVTHRWLAPAAHFHAASRASVAAPGTGGTPASVSAESLSAVAVPGKASQHTAADRATTHASGRHTRAIGTVRAHGGRQGGTQPALHAGEQNVTRHGQPAAQHSSRSQTVHPSSRLKTPHTSTRATGTGQGRAVHAQPSVSAPGRQVDVHSGSTPPHRTQSHPVQSSRPVRSHAIPSPAAPVPAALTAPARSGAPASSAAPVHGKSQAAHGHGGAQAPPTTVPVTVPTAVPTTASVGSPTAAPSAGAGHGHSATAPGQSNVPAVQQPSAVSAMTPQSAVPPDHGKKSRP